MSDCAAIVFTSAEPLRGPLRELEEKDLVQTKAKELRRWVRTACFSSIHNAWFLFTANS